MGARPALLGVALALIAPAAAQAAQTATLSAGAKLLDQPRGHPWAIGLDVSAQIAKPDGSQPSALRRLRIKFPHASLNDGAFATCQRARLEARKGPDGCPAGSRIGSGTADVLARPLFPDPVPARIDVFNGVRKKSGRELLFLAATTGRGLSVQVVMGAVLKRLKGGPYGFELNLTVPRLPTIAPYDDASVVRFTTHVEARKRVGGRRISYVEAPTACPQGGLPFLGTFTFADRTSATSKAKISCTLTSVPAA